MNTNDVMACCGRSMSTCVPNFVKTSQIAAELLRFSVFQNGGWPPSWILLRSKMWRQVADCPCLPSDNIILNGRLSYCILWKNSKWRRPPFWICVWQLGTTHEVYLWTWSGTTNLVLIEVLLFKISRFLNFKNLAQNACSGPKNFPFFWGGVIPQ